MVGHSIGLAQARKNSGLGLAQLAAPRLNLCVPVQGLHFPPSLVAALEPALLIAPRRRQQGPRPKLLCRVAAVAGGANRRQGAWQRKRRRGRLPTPLPPAVALLLP